MVLTRILIIAGVSLVVVVGLFVMGSMLDKGNKNEEAELLEKKDGTPES